jgi:hypothetical protein
MGDLMGLFDKLKEMKDAAARGGTLAWWVEKDGVKIIPSDGPCDGCGGAFEWVETQAIYPIPLSKVRSKPKESLLNLGGFCVKCQRMLCPKEAEWVAFTIQGDDWWMPGCKRCQEVLVGRVHRAKHKR